MKAVYRTALEQQLYLPGALFTLYEKEIVAVCSPHGYDLQTGFAVVYGLIRAEQVRTLYLDFTYYNGFFDIASEDVGDLFYELHKQSVSMGAILMATVQRFGSMDYLPPVRTQMDLDDLTGEDFTGLLQRVLQESEYELVVLNMPVRPRFLRAVYDCCSRVYSLRREGVFLFPERGGRGETAGTGRHPRDRAGRRGALAGRNPRRGEPGGDPCGPPPGRPGAGGGGV